MNKTLHHIHALRLSLKGLTLMALAFTPFFFGYVPLSAHAKEVENRTPTFTLTYRAQNRWVHVKDNKPLNNLTQYAKKNQVYTFQVILPESSDTNLYIERLLVLSRIMKGRLKRDSIVFRQDLGQASANTIRVTPLSQAAEALSKSEAPK